MMRPRIAITRMQNHLLNALPANDYERIAPSPGADTDEAG